MIDSFLLRRELDKQSERFAVGSDRVRRSLQLPEKVFSKEAPNIN